MKTEFEFPVIELVDRYTIARVKYEKTAGANEAELAFYTKQIAKLDQNLIKDELEQLESIHRQIWNLEFKKNESIKNHAFRGQKKKHGHLWKLWTVIPLFAR